MKTLAFVLIVMCWAGVPGLASAQDTYTAEFAYFLCRGDSEQSAHAAMNEVYANMNAAIELGHSYSVQLFEVNIGRCQLLWGTTPDIRDYRIVRSHDALEAPIFRGPGFLSTNCTFEGCPLGAEASGYVIGVLGESNVVAAIPVALAERVQEYPRGEQR